MVSTPEHLHTLVHVENDGEVVCGTCGEVIEERVIDQSPQSIYTLEGYYTLAQNGGPSKLSIHDKGLHTVMSNRNTDSSGTKIKGKQKAEFQRLRIWDSRSKQKQKERSLTKAFTILTTSSSKLGIPEGVTEDAAFVCRKAMSKNVAKGRSVSEVIGACLYIACRRTEFPRTLDEISKSIGITKKRLSRTFRMIIFELEIKMDVPKPENYLSRICNELKVSERCKRVALMILDELKKKDGHVGAKPNLVCATVIYYSGIYCKENVTQNQLSKIANTSTISLRKYINDQKFITATNEVIGDDNHS